jgi:hypothetical protein
VRQPLLLLALGALLAVAPPARTQPTYRLDVKPELKPRATLTLEGEVVVRSSVSDDPGFRLQLHFTQAGKTIATVEARSSDRVRPPLSAAGTYEVVLELFYPGYKGGTGLKGQFKPISDPLSFTFAPAKPLQRLPARPPTPAPPKKP